MDHLPSFEIVVGTYEEFLLGYKVEDLEEVTLKQSFATHEHSSSLRTLTNSGKYLASGGADDRIHIYDMSIRKEHVMLPHHNSTINCLEFTTGNTHLISSSIDGTLAITRVGNWVLEKTWEKSHKNGYVVALALHPSGKLALTFGSDCTLQTWNLIKGRKAFTINLMNKSKDAKSLNFLKWSLNEEDFLIGGGLNLEIWNINTGGLKKAFTFTSKVICASYITKNVIVVGHESGKLTLLNIEKNNQNEINAHETRVKCLAFKDNFLTTASSSGEIKLWSYKSKELTEIVSTNTGCRITCLALVSQTNTSKVEEKSKEDDAEKVEMEKAKKIFEAKQKIIIEESDDEGKMTTKKNKRKSQEVTSEETSKIKKNKRNKKKLKI